MNRQMHKGHGRSGAVLVLVVISIVALVAFLGLAIDGGNAYAHRRQMQNAADAAALAGASLLCNGRSDAEIWARVQQYAAYNHADTNGVSAWYTDNANEQVGSLTGDGSVPPTATGVKVTTKTTVTTFFARVVGFMAFQPRATAIARTRCGLPTILVLDPTAKGSLNMSGGSILNLPNGAVVVNSSDSAAFTISSGSAGITAKEIRITGDYVATGGSQNNLQPKPQTGVAPTPDPLADLPAPSTAGMLVLPGVHISGGTATLQPGVYTGQIAISGGATVTFEPGTYVLQGGINSSGGSTLQGNGVMFYNEGQMTISGGGTVNFVPPSGGTYAGITVFQARGDTAKVTLSGGSGSIFAGTYYFPDTQLLDLSGDSNLQLGSMITWQMNLSGGSFEDGPQGPSSATVIALVE